jgi:hypothetical protein
MADDYLSGLVVVDGYLHAGRRRMFGASALCGAGRIVQQVLRPLTRDDAQACAACLSALPLGRAPSQADDARFRNAPH